MFKGIPGDQFHHFIGNSRTQSPLSFNGSFPSFDPYYQTEKLQTFETVERTEEPWSGDEVLALLRIRSTMENWFPDFVWEQVSRKMAEMGYKRSPEKCKEKFEEESRYFSNVNNYSKMNARVFGDVEELNIEETRRDNGDNDVMTNQVNKETKRKRSLSSKKKFEMFKGFCESVVQKILTQQEEMHAKLLEDMAKIDEEKAAREAEWKRREMDRLEKELELRAHEQAQARTRQDAILKFLSMITSSSSAPQALFDANPNVNSSAWSASLDLQNDASTVNRAPKRAENEEDLGKRWPRDEVLALINLRCSLYASGEQEKEGVKAPVWERISQGMMDLGYRRSAKRCKEKWENINKYFRKTKDINKNRPVDSRTCPYFHQLDAWYSQVSTSDGSKSGPESP